MVNSIQRRSPYLCVFLLLVILPALAQTPTPPGKLIDIGGRRLHLNCTGTGSPTVVSKWRSASPSSGSSPTTLSTSTRHAHLTYTAPVCMERPRPARRKRLSGQRRPSSPPAKGQHPRSHHPGRPIPRLLLRSGLPTTLPGTNRRHGFDRWHTRRLNHTRLQRRAKTNQPHLARSARPGLQSIVAPFHPSKPELPTHLPSTVFPPTSRTRVTGRWKK